MIHTKKVEHSTILRCSQLSVLLFFFIFLCCMRVAPIAYSAQTFEVQITSSESSGSTSNLGVIFLNGHTYDLPAKVLVVEGSHFVYYLPDDEYVLNYWELSKIKFEAPKNGSDNPTLINFNETGSVKVFYKKGPPLDVSIIHPTNASVFSDLPINLKVNVTQDGEPVMDAETTFYANSRAIATNLTDSRGGASINFEPKKEKIFTWNVTATKKGFTTGVSDSWKFAYEELDLSPQDNEKISTYPLSLTTIVELDGKPVENALVSFFIDDNYVGRRKTQPNGCVAYTFQGIAAGPHFWHVTAQIPEWDTITSETFHFTYRPELSIALEYPVDEGVVDEAASAVELRALVTSDNKGFQDATVSFFVSDQKPPEYQGFNVSDIQGSASFYFEPEKENVTYWWYATVTKSGFYNDTSNTWSFYYPEQPPCVEVDEIFTSRSRADVGSEQTIGFHLRWENGSNVRGATVRITDGQEGVTDDSGWAMFTITSSIVGEKAWKIIDMSCDGMGEVRHNKMYPRIIWDRVSIELSLDRYRVDVGTDVALNVYAVYEYDNTKFYGLISYNTELHSEAVCEKVIEVSGISDDAYGLSAFESNDVTVIWDRVVLDLDVENERVEVGSEARIDVNGFYEFDSEPFLGKVEFNDTLVKNELGKYPIEVVSVVDRRYGLSSFVSNPALFICDDISVDKNTVVKSLGKVDVIVNLFSKFDGKPVEGMIKVNGDSAEYDSSKNAYKRTISIWLPFVNIDYEINCPGFERMDFSESMYHMGNICFYSGFSLVGIISIFVVRKIDIG